MGAERSLHKLLYMRLRDLSNQEAHEYVAAIVPLVVTTLEQHGPLPVEGLVHYVRYDHDLFLLKDDLRLTMYYGEAEAEIVEAQLETGLHRGLYYYATKAQAAAGQLPVIPPQTDYADGYYTLHRLLEAAREDSSILDAPDDFLRALRLL